MVDHSFLNGTFLVRVNEILWSFYHAQGHLGRTSLDNDHDEKFFKEVVKRSIRPGSQETDEFSLWIKSSSYIDHKTQWDDAFKRSGQMEVQVE